MFSVLIIAPNPVSLLDPVALLDLMLRNQVKATWMVGFTLAARPAHKTSTD